MSRSGSGRPQEFGYTVIEAVVVVVLLAMLLTTLLGSAVAGSRALRRAAALSETIEAARIARALAERVAAGDGVVGPAERPDEALIHLPIGWAERCDSSFVWHGIRAPDPSRDSAVVLDTLSRLHRVRLSESRPSPCSPAPGPGDPAPNGSMRTIETAPNVPGTVLVRVFESGVVRIDDAVRYARLGTARQPLTVAGLDPSESGVGVEDGALRLVVADGIRRWEGVWTGR